MNLLDMRTIIFSNTVTDIACILVILFLWHQSRKRFAGTGFWVFDFAFQTAAMFLIILRGSVPDWMSMVLSNTLVIAGAILGYMGLGYFVGKKISQVHNYVLLAAFACVHAYFTFVQPSLAARTLNISAGLLIICFQCMWLLVHRVEPGVRRLTLGVGMVFGAYCLVSVVRIVAFFTGTPAANNFFHSGTFESLMVISYQMLFILLTYTLALMVNKRLHVEVETQEEKFAKAFHSSPYAIMLTRLSDGQIVEVNDGFVNMAGYANAEVMGRTTVDLELWDKEEDRGAVVDELSKNRKVQGREFQFRKKSGERITGLFSADIIPINNQEYVLSSISDITERKRAEEALRQSEQRWATTLASIGDGVIATDVDGRITFMNAVAESLTGWILKGASQVPMTEVFRIINEQTRKEVENPITKVLRAGNVIGLGNHTLLIRKDGTEVAIDDSGAPIKDQDGKIVGVVLVFRDITERKAAEEALRESEREFAAMFERAAVGKSLTDPATNRILRVNKAFADMLGYSTNELCQMTFVDITHPEDRERDLAGYDLVRKGSSDKWQIEKRYVRKDGSIMWADVSGNIIRYEDGRPARTIAVIQDITGRKRVEEALQTTLQRLHALVANMNSSVLLAEDEGGVAFANQTFCDYFELPDSPAELVATRTDEMVDKVKNAYLHPDEEVVRIKEILRQGQRVTGEEIAMRNGRSCLRDFIPIYVDGKSYGRLWQHTDITERKRVEEELRDHVRLLDDVIDGSTFPIFLKDKEGKFITINAALERMLGKSRQELKGKTDYDIAPKELADYWRSHDERVTETGTAIQIEEIADLPDGHHIFLANKFPLVNAHGQVYGVGAISHDITERKRMEEALRESEAKANALIKYAPTGIYEIDYRRPSFVSVNDAMCQLSGYTREELFSLGPAALLDDESRKRFAERVRLQLAGEKIDDSVEFNVRKKDGSIIFVTLQIAFSKEKPHTALVIGHDITERKATEEELRKAHDELETRVRERTFELSEAVARLRAENIQRKRLEDTLRESENQVRFFASQCLTAQETERKRVAGELHDSIAASLSAMKIRIEKAAEEMKQGHGKPESLQDLGSKVMEINNEVRRIMADLRPSVLDDLGIIAAMNWFCREYQKTYSHISVEKQIGISEDQVPDSLKTPIFRISQEALNNIAKYSRGSLINLSLQKEDNRILLAIRDNGRGFNPDTAKRGLGLSTMRERAQLSGGAFELESTIGKGTIVRVSWAI